MKGTALGQAKGKEEKKAVHHMEVHKNKSTSGGYIVHHHHVNPMHESETHHVPEGQLDKHAEEHMGMEEEQAENPEQQMQEEPAGV